MRKLLAVVIALEVSACGGNSSAPSPTTASLHVGVDISTCSQLGPVTVSVDGTVVGTVVPGSAGVTTQVTIGTHSVSGIGTTTDQLHSTTWAPYAVDVPAGSFDFTLYCNTNRGYSVTRADARGTPCQDRSSRRTPSAPRMRSHLNRDHLLEHRIDNCPIASSVVFNLG